MKKNSYLIFILLLFSFVWILCPSCQSDRKKQSVSDKIDNETFQELTERQQTDVNYQIPSPIEMFLFMQQDGCSFVKEALHNPEKEGEYSTTTGKALNFGVYSADLAYCSVFGDNQGALTYFNIARKMANDLGLYEGFGEEIAKRIDENLNTVDSLIDISVDSYNFMTQALKDQGLSDRLGFILAGGWTESLYLAFESMPKFDLNDPVVERIVDQQILLDNLIAYLKQINQSENITKLIAQLEGVREIYDRLYDNHESEPITKKQFVDLSNKVHELRNSFVSQL